MQGTTYTKNINILNQAVLKSVNAASEEEIIKNFTNVTIEVLNADYGFSWFKDDWTKEFRLVYKDPRTPFEPTVPRSTGITQKAFAAKTPAYTSDYTKSPWAIKDFEPHIKGFVSIPLSYQNNNYGTFNICFREVHNFTAEEESLCIFIGHSAAQAITIHRLVEMEKAARMEAENQKDRFQALIEHSYDIIALISNRGEILYMSPSANRIFGYVLDSLVGKKVTEFVFEKDLSVVRGRMQEILSSPEVPQILEFRYRHKDGSVRWLEATAVNMLSNPRVGSIVANVRDITERKQAQETILHQALHDSLTNLPNRKEFKIRLNQAIEIAKRHSRSLGLLFLDLDRFKSINDGLGHAVGDTLLKVVASRFVSCVRSEDTVARFGGDEFLILLNEINSAQEAVMVANKILKSVAIPVQVGAHTFHPTVSIGIAVYPHDGLDGDALKKHADIALYRAKQQGRNGYSLYDPSMDTYATEKFAMESELRDAIAQNQIVLYYQPIINIKTGKVVALEALVRWQHPAKGLLLPKDFIALAEESGLILPLTEYILRTACRQYKAWQVAGLPKFRVAVNLSAKSFTETDFIAHFENLLKECEMDPSSLEIEITESLAMGNFELTSNNLKQLRKMGVRITIDDFGTGYSSLSYLRRFPVNNLKIDRSFVRHCITNEHDASITRTIVSMAHGLNLKVIAEGVETDQQLSFLASLGCNAVQGYFLAQPMPADKLAAWLEEKSLSQHVAGVLVGH